jgi:hypothetical protein
MPLRCVFCGLAHLPSERCGSDTEAGLARSVFKAAVIQGQAFVQDGRVLRGEEVLAASSEAERARFDRAKYQREYMRGWRARKKGGAT